MKTDNDKADSPSRRRGLNRVYVCVTYVLRVCYKKSVLRVCVAQVWIMCDTRK